jgi:hypothetical protein
MHKRTKKGGGEFTALRVIVNKCVPPVLHYWMFVLSIAFAFKGNCLSAFQLLA